MNVKEVPFFIYKYTFCQNRMREGKGLEFGQSLTIEDFLKYPLPLGYSTIALTVKLFMIRINRYWYTAGEFKTHKCFKGLHCF